MPCASDGQGLRGSDVITQDYRSSTYSWYVVVTLMIGYLFAYIDRTMIGLMVVPIQADLQISDTKMSLLMGLAFVLFFSIASLPVGYMADRFNRIRLLKVGAVIWCFMTVACGLSNTFVQLFFCRMMVGLGEATLAPTANSLISDYFKPASVARAFSIFTLGVAGGAGLSMILGGQMIAWASGLGAISLPVIGALAPWQLVFVIIGSIGIIFLLMLFTVKEPMRTGRKTTDASWTIAQTGVYFKDNARLYACLFISQIFCGAIGFGILNWTPTFLIRVHQWSPAEAGLKYGVVSIIASISGIVLSGLWIDRRRKRGEIDAAWRVMMFGIIFLMPCFIIAPLFDNAWVTLGLFWIAILGVSMSTVAVPTAIMSATPNEARAIAAALFYLTVNLIGTSIGPTAIAMITDYGFADQNAVGYSISIVAVVCVVGAIFCSYYGLTTYRKRVEYSETLQPAT